jgi:oligopeptide/dipeptide ABC transporter ATP-binding protein
MNGAPIIEVRDLRVQIRERGRTFVPVDDVSFEAAAGSCFGLVGESGCGKSMTLRSLLALLPTGARVAGGTMRLRQEGELTAYDPIAVRGRGIAMVFQEPMTALNPLIRIGDLIGDAFRATHPGERRRADARVSELMREVGIPAPHSRKQSYPHQLSGGLRQRVMIAMALASEPQVLLCDEPTTALDVTVQEQILILLERIRRERGLAIIYVTHDLAVVSEICDHISVMYAGRIVESGPIETVLGSPAHPYTAALIASIPRFQSRGAGQLRSIGGMPPDPRAFPTGCRFHPRCPLAIDACTTAEHTLRAVTKDQTSACIRHAELFPRPAEVGQGLSQ